MHIRSFAFVLSLLASTNLHAMTEYVPKPLTNLNVSQGMSRNGVTVATKILNQNDLEKLFGAYADALAQHYLFINVTIQNHRDINYMLDANTVEFPLANASEIVASLNPLITKTALTKVFSSISSLELLPSGTRVLLTPEGIKGGGGMFDYLRARWITHDLGLPQMTTDLAFWGAVLGNPMLLAFGFSPAVIWGTAIAHIYKMYKTKPLIERDLKDKILAPHEQRIIKPHATGSFLLVVPEAYASLAREKIKHGI